MTDEPQPGRMADIGARIRELRTERGISLRALADQVGVGFPHISKIENGHEWPSKELVRKIADALGTNEPIELHARTATERYFASRLADPEYRAAYERAHRELTQPDVMPVMGDEPDDLDAFIAEQGDDFRHELALAELRAEVARLTAERDDWHTLADGRANGLVLARREVERLESEVARLTAERDEADETNGVLLDRCVALEDEVARLTAELDRWVDQWVDQWVMADRAITGLHAEVARLTAKRDDALAALHVEWQSHSADVARLTARIAELEEQADAAYWEAAYPGVNDDDPEP